MNVLDRLKKESPGIRSIANFLASNGGYLPDDIYVVGKTGSRDHSEIQDAINRATTLSKKGCNIDIIVKSGNYNEALNIPDCNSGGLTAMGTSMAQAGTIRLIGNGYVKIYQGDAATAPTITVKRPCVELHNLVPTSLSAQPAVYAICDNNTDAGGTTDNGFAAGLVINNCNVRGGGPDDDPVALGKGISLEGALKTVITNTLIENFVTGLLLNGSSVNFSQYNRFENVSFDGNTNDISADAQRYNYFINCNWLDANATTYLTTQSLQANTGNKIIGGFVMAADLTKFKGVAGFGAVGIVGAAANALLYDLDLTA